MSPSVLLPPGLAKIWQHILKFTYILDKDNNDISEAALVPRQKLVGHSIYETHRWVHSHAYFGSEC